jgi:hypothetical protein
VFLNYRKSERSSKITKLVGELCYHMYGLCARIEKISSKLRRLMPKTQTSPGVLSYWSHVEMYRFEAQDIATCSKSSQLLHTTSTCDSTTARQVSWFSDFVRIFCNLETLFPISCSACHDNKMLDISCELLDTASIYTKYYESHFLNRQIIWFHVCVVQIWSVPRNSRKQKKLTKYTYKIQNWTKLEQRVLNNVARHHQKMEQKTKKNKNISLSASA